MALRPDLLFHFILCIFNSRICKAKVVFLLASLILIMIKSELVTLSANFKIEGGEKIIGIYRIEGENNEKHYIVSDSMGNIYLYAIDFENDLQKVVSSLKLGAPVDFFEQFKQEKFYLLSSSFSKIFEIRVENKKISLKKTVFFKNPTCFHILSGKLILAGLQGLYTLFDISSEAIIIPSTFSQQSKSFADCKFRSLSQETRVHIFYSEKIGQIPDKVLKLSLDKEGNGIYEEELIIQGLEISDVSIMSNLEVFAIYDYKSKQIMLADGSGKVLKTAPLIDEAPQHKLISIWSPVPSENYIITSEGDALIIMDYDLIVRKRQVMANFSVNISFITPLAQNELLLGSSGGLIFIFTLKNNNEKEKNSLSTAEIGAILAGTLLFLFAILMITWIYCRKKGIFKSLLKSEALGENQEQSHINKFST